MTTTRRATPLLARLAAASLAVALLGGGAVAAAHADDLDDRKAAAEKRAQQLEDKQEDLKASLENTSAKLAQAYLDLQSIQAKIPVAQADLDIANAKVDTTLREQQALAERLADAQATEKQLAGQVAQGATQVADAHDEVAQMARRAMRGDGALTSLGVVTGAQSTQQFVDDYALAKTVSRTQTRELRSLQDAQALATNRTARLAAVRDQIADLKTQADQKVVEAKDAQQVAAQRKKTLDGLLADQQAKTAIISAQKAKGQVALDQNEADTKASQHEIAVYAAKIKKRNAERAAAELKRQQEEAKKHQHDGGSGGKSGGSGGGSSGGSSGGSGGGSGGGGGSSVTSGRLAWPVANSYVTSPFGNRFHPIYHVWMMHTGVDLHAPCGTPITAAASGTVVSAGWSGNYGNRVVIDNGAYKSYELFTTYNHMINFVVRAGQHVSTGQLVGHAGTFGVSTGCHLHFEVLEDGTFVNPMSFLG